MIVIISKSSGQMICILLWPQLSFNTFCDSLDTRLPFLSLHVLIFLQKEAGQLCGIHCLNSWVYLQPSGTQVTLAAGGGLAYLGRCLLCWLEAHCAPRWNGTCVHCLRCRLQPCWEGWKRREAGVNVTVELFQLSLEPADAPGMCHESCCWQRPMWVWTRGEEPSLEGQTPELSEPALTHI